MYASLRRIKCVSGKTHEVARRIEEQFVPRLRAMDGFVGYYFVDTGNDEVASISIFQNQHEAEDANQQAGMWVRQTLSDVVTGPLEAQAGEVLVHTTM